MGQYIQEGRRALFETFVELAADKNGVTVPQFGENLDGLAYLEGKELDWINKTACEATREAHLAGGVSVLEVVMPDLDERSLGGLIYFFEMACALSGFVLGVNPFNQPGVEAYKKNMFALLDKPGYEAESKAIKERIANE
jgi:glucose-6-phosphate isomerase